MRELGSARRESEWEGRLADLTTHDSHPCPPWRCSRRPKEARRWDSPRPPPLQCWRCLRRRVRAALPRPHPESSSATLVRMRGSQQTRPVVRCASHVNRQDRASAPSRNKTGGRPVGDRSGDGRARSPRRTSATCDAAAVCIPADWAWPTDSQTPAGRASRSARCDATSRPSRGLPEGRPLIVFLLPPLEAQAKRSGGGFERTGGAGDRQLVPGAALALGGDPGFGFRGLDGAVREDHCAQ